MWVEFVYCSILQLLLSYTLFYMIQHFRWVHIKCNKINLQTYRFLEKSPLAWYCIKCFKNIVSFGTISNEELFKTNHIA